MIMKREERRPLLDYDSYKPEGYPVMHRSVNLYELDLEFPEGYGERVQRILDLDEELAGLHDFDIMVDAMASDVHRSVGFEGNPLSEEQVRELISVNLGRINKWKYGPHKKEIVNHIPDLHGGSRVPFDADYAEDLHRRLMDGVVPEDRLGIRTEDVSVYGDDGTECFRPCPAVHVRGELDSLWDAVYESDADPVTRAALYFIEFESIHPFLDGNGSTGRQLLRVMLQTLGLKSRCSVMLERMVLSDAERYYDLLAYADSAGDPVPFVCFFADCLLDAYEKAVRRHSAKSL